jgi:hypothetical protein
VRRILSEDLQFTCLFWLGNIYFNIGDYESCFNFWKKFHENYDKSFNFRPGNKAHLQNNKKLQKVKLFLKQYDVLCENLLLFKENILFMKKTLHGLNLQQIQDFFSDLDTMKKLNPNIKYKHSLIFEYYKALVFNHVVKNEEEAIRLYCNIINYDYTFTKAYFKLFKLLKKSCSEQRSLKILIKYAFFLLKNTLNDEVDSKSFIKALIYYSKSLFLNEKYEEAITILINSLDIFVNFSAIEEICFLNKINADNKISTNVFVNFDKAIKFYSKFHVFKKSDEMRIFSNNFRKRKSTEQVVVELRNQTTENANELYKKESSYVQTLENPNDQEERSIDCFNSPKLNFNQPKSSSLSPDKSRSKKYSPLNQPYNTSFEPNFINLSNMQNDMSGNDSYQVHLENVPDINIKNISMLEDYIDSNIDHIEINGENNSCIKYLNI